MPGPIAFPKPLAIAYGNETVSQFTTNPPSPNIDGSAAPDESKYDKMSAGQRWATANVDAVKKIGHSMDHFIHHPFHDFVPLVQAGVQSTIQPFIHPDQTIASIKDYYKKKGPIEGTAQALYSITTAGAGAAIAVGGAALLGTAVGLPLAGVAAGAMTGVEILGAAGLVSNGVQFAYDEAQSAAPESGARLPKWVPFVGGKQIFKPTTHDQQAELLKFDLLNVGGSAVVYGIAKAHNSMENGLPKDPVTGKPSESLLPPAEKAAFDHKQRLVHVAEISSMAAVGTGMVPDSAMQPATPDQGADRPSGAASEAGAAAADPQAAPGTTPRPAAPTEASPAPAAPAPPATYTVKPGDDLSTIAKQQLGDASRWPEIYALNRDVIGPNPGTIQPGQVLTLPGETASAPQAPDPQASGAASANDYTVAARRYN